MNSGPDDRDDRDDRDFAGEQRGASEGNDQSAQPPWPGEPPSAPEPPPPPVPPEPPAAPPPPTVPPTGSAWHPSWPPESAAPAAHAGVPWEERDRIGFLAALFATVRLSLFEPTHFFSRLHPQGAVPPPPGGPIGSPILYAILVGVPGAIASIFWQFVVSSLGLFSGGDAGEALFTVGTSVIAAALSPILIPLALLITTAIIHVVLLLFGGAKEGFLASFRVLCYSSAPELFQIIPLCGILSGVWWVVIAGIGLKVVHRTTFPRAFGALLLPLLACCGLLALLVFMAGMAGLLDAMG